MSLDVKNKEIVHLSNGIGSASYEKIEDGWYEMVAVSVYDTPEKLYHFFKDLALHFKDVLKKEDDF